MVSIASELCTMMKVDMLASTRAISITAMAVPSTLCPEAAVALDGGAPQVQLGNAGDQLKGESCMLPVVCYHRGHLLLLWHAALAVSPNATIGPLRPSINGRISPPS